MPTHWLRSDKYQRKVIGLTRLGSKPMRFGFLDLPKWELNAYLTWPSIPSGMLGAKMCINVYQCVSMGMKGLKYGYAGRGVNLNIWRTPPAHMNTSMDVGWNRAGLTDEGMAMEHGEWEGIVDRVHVRLAEG